MPRYVAFLRAINVGGHTVTMERLRALFGELGLADVESFIASGNLIFRGKATAPAALEVRIEAHLEKALGYEVKTFLRTDADVAAIAASQPFSTDAVAEAKALNVGLLSEPLGAAAKKALAGLRTDVDDFHTKGREVYWLCRMRQSESKFNNVRFEKLVGVRATFRGMNTMTKLAAKYPPA